MDSLQPIDLLFGTRERAIGVYLVETDDGLALFDCGPTSTRPALESGLAERGVGLGDIRHLLLSHIHLDHAGAAGPLVRDHPQLTVWVSEIGAPHLIDPLRSSSARHAASTAISSTRSGASWRRCPSRTSPRRTATCSAGRRSPTQGHASHHVSYLRDGTLLRRRCSRRADARRVVLLPVSPPPDVDVEAWHATTDAIRSRSPEAPRVDPLRRARGRGHTSRPPRR